ARRDAGEYRAGPDVLGAEDEAEVGVVGQAALVEADVGRLDVPVDEAAAVGVVEGVGGPGDDGGGVPGRDPAAVHPPGEGFALDVFRHHEAEAVGGAADVVDGDDGGVVEHGQGAGLGQVAGEVAGVGDEPAVRHLDGDGAVEVLVLGED